MDIWQAAVLALVQGVTEFLPISSSAHLILLPKFMAWTDGGVAFDAAAHLGTLCAVVFHFRRQLAAWPRSAEGRAMLAMVGAASLPVLAAGYLLEAQIVGNLRAAPIIAAATIGFALALWLADRRQGTERRIRPGAAMLIGLAQTLALIPGASRTGVTLTAALLLGVARREAAEFSFLLSIPVIAAVAAFELTKLTAPPAAWTAIGVGFLVSALVAFAALRFFLALVVRVGLAPFVVYRLALGGVILAVL